MQGSRAFRIRAVYVEAQLFENEYAGRSVPLSPHVQHVEFRGRECVLVRSHFQQNVNRVYLRPVARKVQRRKQIFLCLAFNPLLYLGLRRSL